MAKQSIALVVLSLLAVVFMSQLNHVLDVLVGIHNHIAKGLHFIFADDKVGLVIQDMIALLLIPLISGFALTLSYWLAKRSQMPYMMTVVWVVWLVLLTTMIAQNDEEPGLPIASKMPGQRHHMQNAVHTSQKFQQPMMQPMTQPMSAQGVSRAQLQQGPGAANVSG